MAPRLGHWGRAAQVEFTSLKLSVLAPAAARITRARGFEVSLATAKTSKPATGWRANVRFSEVPRSARMSGIGA